jgi:hypothetical protein
MTFARRRNRLTTHFLKRIPVVKRRISVFSLLGRVLKQNVSDVTNGALQIRQIRRSPFTAVYTRFIALGLRVCRNERAVWVSDVNSRSAVGCHKRLRALVCGRYRSTVHCRCLPPSDTLCWDILQPLNCVTATS